MAETNKRQAPLLIADIYALSLYCYEELSKVSDKPLVKAYCELAGEIFVRVNPLIPESKPVKALDEKEKIYFRMYSAWQLEELAMRKDDGGNDDYVFPSQALSLIDRALAAYPDLIELPQTPRLKVLRERIGQIVISIGPGMEVLLKDVLIEKGAFTVWALEHGRVSGEGLDTEGRKDA